MENKEHKLGYMPVPLKKKVMEYRYGNPDSCDVITSKGKRCKNTFKYRFQDQVKDCGQYCSKHCDKWMEELLKNLIFGSLVINDRNFQDFQPNIYFKNDNMNMELGFVNTIKKLMIELSMPKESLKFEIEKKYSRLNSKKMSKVDKFISEISKRLCPMKKIQIKLSGNINEEIRSIGYGDIRGWHITREPDDDYFRAEKIYRVEEEKI